VARPFRYTFILVLVGAGAVLAAVGGWRFARASAPVSGPIVLISVDTLRADRLPIYGYDGVRTPGIDSLAADGIVFEHAYTPSPSTLPAHAALMSGRLPFRTGVRTNVGGQLPADETMLAEVLRDRAYATAGIVSSYALNRESGIGQGFGFFDDEVSEPWSGRRDELQRDGESSVQLAEDWLSSAGTQRAFLFLHLNDPHQPPRVRSAGSTDSYLQDVEYVDGVIARLIDYLKSHQLYDQSTLILLSDHGEGLGDHVEREHGLLVYDEALRVPLIIKPAANEQGGRRVSDVVQLVDIMPTILDLAKAPLPDGLDGRSLTALIEGAESMPGRLAYAESLYGLHHFGWSQARTITDGRYRYIRSEDEELYDLDADPDQSRNIVEIEPEVASRLSTALDDLVRSDTIAPLTEVTPDVRARFAVLGDVGAGRTADLTTDPAVETRDRAGFVNAYRDAVGLFADGEWLHGTAALERLARSQPDAPGLWRDLGDMAAAAGRHDLASEAYRRVMALEPDAPDAQLGAARASLLLRRLDDARRRAEAAIALAGETDSEAAARGFELLVRVAITRQDWPAAFALALQGENADPRLPLVAYVEGRRHFEAGRYADAAAAFEDAIAALDAAKGAPRIADLHLRTAESLIRLDRLDEAEVQYAREIAAFPRSNVARQGLAMLLHNSGRAEEASETLSDLLRFVPTPDAYSLAARLWTTFGDVERASAVRAEAGELFTAPKTTINQ
jgi:arylsulfatase A-like enzyme/tetratricopeptide (TPR) repeat protein